MDPVWIVPQHNALATVNICPIIVFVVMWEFIKFSLSVQFQNVIVDLQVGESSRFV
jgi:hypothetical protein